MIFHHCYVIRGWRIVTDLLKINDTGESAVPDDHAQPTPAAVRAIDESCQPIAGSAKIYITGSRADIRVPMRQIRQSPTPLANGEFEQNPPIAVYDTSGPYTDDAVQIDVRKGLAPLRDGWIAERGDSEELAGLSSEFGRRREQDPMTAGLRFAATRKPRRAKAGANVSQMHYARKGIITPEMEFIAIRENQNIAAARAAGLPVNQHPKQSFGAAIPA